MKERILEFMKKEGPIVPIDIATHFKMDSIFASAHLSDLSSKKLIKISKLKVGSSPLYYLPEDAEKLEGFVNKLPPKDQASFQLLKEKRVLRDTKLPPLQRVSLRSLKDFATPLEVNFGDHKEIFWKFYSISNEDSHKFIEEIMSAGKSKPEPKTEPKVEAKPEPKAIPKPEPKTEPKVEVKSEPKAEPEPKPETKAPKVEAKPKLTQIPAAPKPVQKEISLQEEIQDPLHEKIKAFFDEKNITIISTELIKKNSEIDYVITLPSNLAYHTFFCKVKDKKRISGADLAGAFVGGELKGLPIILLTNGTMTKGTEEKARTDFKKVAVVPF